MMKTMIKFAAVAVLAAGLVLWQVHQNRNVRVSGHVDEDTDLNDLGSEMSIPNMESDDIIRPREQLFPFPELREAGLRRNVVLTNIDSWKSTVSEWRSFKQLRIAGSLATGAYGQVMVAFVDEEREVALKGVNKEALAFRGPGFIAREVAIMESLNQENLISMLAWFENDTAVNIVMQRAKFGSVKS